ncbi:unnamed protein product [Penicillium salamii]|nr:unnamed protein product [Penicillium salamii]CAG8350122.1 unnamed protein product [Penicillium salamii]
MTPCRSILAACRERYGQTQTDALSPAYIYVVMMENSTYYAMNGELGQLFRQLLYDHLCDEWPKASDMSRLIYITLAVKTEVLICCDIFYDMRAYTAATREPGRGGGAAFLAGRAMLETFQPVSDSDTVIGIWRIEFSFSDFRPRVSRIGSLEDLCSIFRPL